MSQVQKQSRFSRFASKIFGSKKTEETKQSEADFMARMNSRATNAAPSAAVHKAASRRKATNRPGAVVARLETTKNLCPESAVARLDTLRLESTMNQEVNRSQTDLKNNKHSTRSLASTVASEGRSSILSVSTVLPSLPLEPSHKSALKSKTIIFCKKDENKGTDICVRFRRRSVLEEVAFIENRAQLKAQDQRKGSVCAHKMLKQIYSSSNLQTACV